MVHIIRGLPGVGKTEYARVVYQHEKDSMLIIDSNQFWIDGLGQYVYDSSRKDAAQAYVLAMLKTALSNHVTCAVVGVFPTKDDIDPIMALAKEFESNVAIWNVNGTPINTRDIPDDEFASLIDSFQGDLPYPANDVVYNPVSWSLMPHKPKINNEAKEDNNNPTPF